MKPIEEDGARKRMGERSPPPALNIHAMQVVEMPDRALNLPVKIEERPSSLTPYQNRVLEETADTYDRALSALSK